MLDTDRTEFYSTWVSVMDLYGKTIQPQSAEIVFAVLNKYDIMTVKQALEAHLKDTEAGRFPPKPADIIKQIEGGADIRALQAWTKVEGAIRDVGSWFNLVFDDPVIHRCVEDMGGWMTFASVTNDELPFKQNQFVKRYQGYISNPPAHWPRVLIGESDSGQLRMIGEIPLCKKVLSGGEDNTKKISGPVQITDLIHRLN